MTTLKKKVSLSLKVEDARVGTMPHGMEWKSEIFIVDIITSITSSMIFHASVSNFDHFRRSC